MVVPELKSLTSPDWSPMSAPADVVDFGGLFQAEIGPKGAGGAETFFFIVVTPRRLLRKGTQWGGGMLIVKEFSWTEIEQAVVTLLTQTHGETWEDCVEHVAKTMFWQAGQQAPNAQGSANAPDAIQVATLNQGPMKQRDMMRDLFRCHGNDEDTLVREYANAERQGKVDRESNERDVDPEEYARLLLADAKKKGWIRGLR